MDRSFRGSRIFRANGTSGTGVACGTAHGIVSRRPSRIPPPVLRATGPGRRAGMPRPAASLPQTLTFPAQQPYSRTRHHSTAQTITTHGPVQMSAARHGWNIERTAHTRRRSRAAGRAPCHGHPAAHAGTASIIIRVPVPSSGSFIAVDPALAVDPGSYGCHSTPRKPDPPRHWDQWDQCAARGIQSPGH